MTPTAEVLARYGSGFVRGAWEDLGSAGGLSGARVWRGRTPYGAWRLKAWPRATTARDVVAFGQALQNAAREAGLTFVPRVLGTTDGARLVETADAWWDVVSWQPGEPGWTASRAIAAGSALARCHAVWRLSDSGLSLGPAPGAAARAEALAAWPRVRATLAGAGPETWALADAIERRVGFARTAIEPWTRTAVGLQPCHGDARAEHFLFTGDAVTGLVDFGGARRDHVGVDLARARMDGHGDALLVGYEAVEPLGPVDRRLLDALEASGPAAAAIEWLRRVGSAPPAPEVTARWHWLRARLDA